MISKFVIFSRDFHALPLADRLKDDGREVTFALVESDEKMPKGKEEARQSLYDGILEKHDVDDVMKWLATIKESEQQDYFLFFDYGSLWPYSEKALKLGFKTGLFPTEDGYRLEEDREFGKDFARKHFPKIKVAEVREFSNVEDGIKFLGEQKDKIFVLKSSGSHAETCVPATDDVDLGRRQIIGALLSEKAGYSKGFTLEELIRNPIEITPVLLCWNGKPLCTLLELENKPLGSGNIGRLTGGCQNLTLTTPFNCPINQIAFPPIVFEVAKKQAGLSIFDAGLLFDGKDFCFTEFCSQRFGFDGFFSEMAMAGDSNGRGCATNFFDSIAAGKNPIKNKFGVAVRLFQTQPSSDTPDMFQGGYAIDWLDAIQDQLFMYCLERKEVEGEEMFVSVGFEKDLATCTGVGASAEEAVTNAYRCVEGVAMNGLYFRPKQDFMSMDYFTAIPNRLKWLLDSGIIAAQGLR